MKTIKNIKITILYNLKRLCDSSPVHLFSFYPITQRYSLWCFTLMKKLALVSDNHS